MHYLLLSSCAKDSLRFPLEWAVSTSPSPPGLIDLIPFAPYFQGPAFALLSLKSWDFLAG